jgi:hypothetical protein
MVLATPEGAPGPGRATRATRATRQALASGDELEAALLGEGLPEEGGEAEAELDEDVEGSSEAEDAEEAGASSGSGGEGEDKGDEGDRGTSAGPGDGEGEGGTQSPVPPSPPDDGTQAAVGDGDAAADEQAPEGATASARKKHTGAVAVAAANAAANAAAAAEVRRRLQQQALEQGICPEEDPKGFGDFVLQRAREIKVLYSPCPPIPEPKRAMTHWDHVLTEMEQISKEFIK